MSQEGHPFESLSCVIFNAGPIDYKSGDSFHRYRKAHHTHSFQSALDTHRSSVLESARLPENLRRGMSWPMQGLTGAETASLEAP
jgi:hypothetical protein